MPEFHITWEIEIQAANPREAAKKALEIQRDPTSLATVFAVIDEDGEGHRIDLAEEEE